MNTDRAIILAGGLGKRLAPYTFVIPKPILPIGTTPILEIVLRQLSAQGIRRVTIALGHMSEYIKMVAGDGSRFGVQVDYTHESKPLGTMGPLHLVTDLPQRFIVMNADLLTDLNFQELCSFHITHRAQLTVATFEKTTKLQLGVLSVDDDSIINGFQEKPTITHKVSMGIYVLERSILDHIPRDVPFGFDTLMTTLLAKGIKVVSYPFQGHCLDIGIPADYEKALEEYEQNRHRYLP